MRLILTLTLAIALSGCSLFSKKDGTEPMELVDFEPTAKIDRIWQRDTGAGQGEGYTRLTPAFDDELLYVVDYEGKLSAINRLSGKVVWRRDLDETIAGGVGLGADQLLLGTDEGELLALSQDDGTELWRTQLSSEIMSVPAGDSAVVAAQTLDGRLTVVNASSGEVLWFYDNPPPKLTLRGRPTPAITGSAIYAGFASGRLMAFNPQNGLILWEQRVAMPRGRSDLEKMVDIQASPLLQDGILYLNGYQGRLMAVTRANGRPLWSIDSSSYQELWLDNGELFVSAADSKVTAYNAAAGTELWSNEQMLRRQVTGAASVGDYVAVADEDGYLHFMNRSDGSFAARTRVDGSGVRAPLWSDGERLYVLANDGTLAAYTLSGR
ncbi:outer membrane protein assembly factor BamB [Gilvimarinus algae]|uniref:Outer membrane protein assembly factor BamB n=1 Tax=Gilvimarinus algae TaxID=3058037 RepID=A0ABT8TEZ5_9GAMM|nr:outer membrane protein assembly factor BamB [Gilvimarinus sp. SDUM040014]MDO3382654.1 outer membrane protein assembly factor BamB [Gilvimarinus sp. SDUM040014]